MNAYQIYYGPGYSLTTHLSYDKINGKALQNDISTYSGEDTFYFNSYLIQSQEELNLFYLTDSLVIENSELTEYFHFKNSSLLFFVFAQVPAGYRAYKRVNKQQETSSGGEIMVTPNFYYYINRPSLSYFYIDVVEDSSVLEPTYVNYVYPICDDATIPMLYTSVRGILSDRAAKSEEIPSEYQSSSTENI